jgi:hypothetical protein
MRAMAIAALALLASMDGGMMRILELKRRSVLALRQLKEGKGKGNRRQCNEEKRHQRFQQIEKFACTKSTRN